MKKTAKTLVHKTIIIFLLVLILLNSIMSGLVFAANTIVQNSDQDFAEYIRILNYVDKNGKKITASTTGEQIYINDLTENSEEYKKVVSDYNTYYKDFNKTASSFSGQKTKSVSNGPTPKLVLTEEYENYLNDKTNKYNTYLDSKNATNANKGQTSEEAEKQQEAIEEEENEWVSKVDSQDNILGSIFQEICKLAVALGDAVLNVVQGWMLPGSPEAVAKRPGNDNVLKDLTERNDGSEYYCFYKHKSAIADINGQKEGEDYGLVRKPDKYSFNAIPYIYYSPSAIFSNKIPALDINFIDSSSQVVSPFVQNYDESYNRIVYTSLLEQDQTDENKEEETKALRKEQENVNNGNKSNPSSVLQNLISKWYVALRNLAILSLLIVLVYVGIRILIASTGEEGAKYKTMLKDWLMAIVLVIVIHYIMVGLIIIVKYIIEMLTSNADFSKGDTIMNTIRAEVVHNLVKDDWLGTMGYGLMYLTIVWYVGIFTWKYLRRVLYMAFLTIIAPLVAITYPIDKIKDGKSQAFDMWFKEYLFNLLIQPIDLLLYTIFVTSAMELVENNFIYAIVAIGFVLQAEKFIKSMFGLNATGGAGKGGFASGALFQGAMQKLQSGSSSISNALGSGSSGKGSSGGASGGSGNGKVRTVDSGARKASSGIPGLASLLKGTSTGGATVRNGQQNRVTSGTNGTAIGGGSNGSTSISGSGSNGRMTNNGAGVLVGGVSPQASNKSGFGKKVIRGLGRVRGRYLNANTGIKLAKTAAKVVGAGALGTVGVAAGLASDDFSNVLKYGALGAAGGAALTGEIMNQAGAIGKGAKETTDTFLQGYYGDEYQDKIANPKEDIKWKYSEDTKSWLISKYGDDWKEKREEAMIYRQYGITDKAEIEKAIKLKQDNPELETAAVGALFKEFKDVDVNDLKKADSRKFVEAKAERIAQQVGGDVDANKNNIMNYLDQKYGLDVKRNYVGNSTIQQQAQIQGQQTMKPPQKAKKQTPKIDSKTNKTNLNSNNPIINGNETTKTSPRFAKNDNPNR